MERIRNKGTERKGKETKKENEKKG